MWEGSGERSIQQMVSSTLWYVQLLSNIIRSGGGGFAQIKCNRAECEKIAKNYFKAVRPEYSVFKKAGWFLHFWLIREPIIEDIVGQSPYYATLKGVDGASNAIIGVLLVRERLFEAPVVWEDGTTKHLDNKINPSKHSFLDIIDALCAKNPPDPKILAVLLEQLAYKTNSHCEYPRERTREFPLY